MLTRIVPPTRTNLEIDNQKNDIPVRIGALFYQYFKATIKTKADGTIVQKPSFISKLVERNF